MELFKDKHKAIMEKAVETWGVEDQFMMAIGECGEFVTLAGRHVQGRLDKEQIIDEVADVLVMMHQMALIYGEQEVRDRIEFKMNKVFGKLMAQGAYDKEDRGKR